MKHGRQRFTARPRALLALVVLLVAFIQSPGFAGSAETDILRVGFIKLGTTLRSVAQRRIGLGRKMVGYYPESARSWRIPGGCMFIDGIKLLKHDDLIVDTVTWAEFSNMGPACRKRLTYLGLTLGTPESVVLSRLGDKYTWTTAFDLRSMYWNWKIGNGCSIDVFASYRKNKVCLLSVDLNEPGE